VPLSRPSYRLCQPDLFEAAHLLFQHQRACPCRSGEFFRVGFQHFLLLLLLEMPSHHLLFSHFIHMLQKWTPRMCINVYCQPSCCQSGQMYVMRTTSFVSTISQPDKALNGIIRRDHETRSIIFQ
jgi:hypothetical protein